MTELLEHGTVHDTVTYALEGMLKHGQFANGGFPQVWNTLPRERAPSPSQRATFPETWSRDYQGHQEYWTQPTLNDNLMSDVLDTLFLAADVYDEPRYYHAALQAADFLLLAQMPEPQPAWAQQYDTAMHPIWARKFEPPAITGGESQAVIRSLLDVFRRTGDQRYLNRFRKLLPTWRLQPFRMVDWPDSTNSAPTPRSTSPAATS